MRSVSSQMSLVSARSSSVGGLLEQLRRASDARKRILDFVRKHRGQRDDRARGAAMGELPVHLVGDRALLQHHDDMAVEFGQRRDMEIDETFAGITRRGEVDLVFVHRRAALPHLFDERQQR